MKDIWTLKYRPALPDGLLGNRRSIDTLKKLSSSGALPHLIFHGPENTGKTTAALGLAASLYGDGRDLNFTYLNASDFFEQGKSYLAMDKRFFRLLGTDNPQQIRKSVIAVFKDILNEYAALAPIDAPFKIIYIDDADALTSDAQNALRRIMEKYSGTCRFIFSVRRASGLIAPLRSRCVTLFFGCVTEDELIPYLKQIAASENIDVEGDGFEMIARSSGGNVATAVEMLQMASTAAPVGASGRQTITSDMIEAEIDRVDPDIVELMKAILDEKDIKKARSIIDKLLFDIGMTGREILEQIGAFAEKAAFSETRAARLHIAIARADERLTGAFNERIVLEAAASEMAGL